jgi:hypothetical protein
VYEQQIMGEAGMHADVTGKLAKQQAVHQELGRLFSRICSTIDQMCGGGAFMSSIE